MGGLVGLVAAELGAEVTLTDLPAVLPFLTAVVERNRAAHRNARAEALGWGDALDIEPGAYDVVLGSDITYFVHLHEPLLLTLLQLCTPETTVLIGHAVRREEFEAWRAVF